MDSWLAVLPPTLAIIVAIWKKEVVSALLVGIWVAETIMVDFNPVKGFIATLERVVDVFQDAGNTRVLLFGLLVGALLELIRVSGGVGAFTNSLGRLGLTKSPRRVGLLASLIGVVIFIETSLSVLTAGVVSQKLFDRFGMSRARLAFIIDSTCAPISVLIVLNGWGAYILGLLDNYGLDNNVAVLAGSIPFNFYALAVLVLVFYTAFSNKVHGALRRYEEQATHTKTNEQEEEVPATRTRYMVVPLAFLVLGMLFFMWYTGQAALAAEGVNQAGVFVSIREGSGSRSVLWAVSLATLVTIVLLLFHKVLTGKEIVDNSFKGIGNLLPVVTIMMLSFAIGSSCKDLGTGTFVANLVGPFLPMYLVAPLLFIAAALISFTTGTSWGTFAILIPVGLPLGMSLGLPPSFVLAAVLGGGVFGDHCSPISDTTVISSLASGCNHLDHVKTQLPYALTAGAFAVLLYLIMGFVVG